MKGNFTHVVWIDYVRVIACAMMVLSHCCDPFVGQFNNNYSDFLTGASFGSAMRACVPLFAMISAVLLLPVEMEMGLFYKKRLKRVVFPLIIWSIILPIAYYLYIGNFGTISPILDVNYFSAENTINKIAFTPINFNYDTTPLWYLYMLIGLYLFLPIISEWLKNASKKSLKTFLTLWGITLFLPYVQLIAPFVGYQGVFGNMGILGVCDWNPFGMFYYFSGFLGYVVLAYYMTKFAPKWNLKKTLAITIPMWLTGYAITLGGFIAVQRFYPTDYAYLEIFWFFNSINVVLMTTALFMIVKTINWKPSKFVTYLASITFGIYLAHFIIIQIFYDNVYLIEIPAYAKILLMAIGAFIVTSIIVAIIKLIPKSKYIIG